MQAIVLVLIAFIGIAAAFSPLSSRLNVRASQSALKMSTYWEGDYPPSSVLGIASKAPSAVLGPASLVAFAVGTYAFHETNILHQVDPTNINAPYVAATFLIPISWGLHVAAWIQKQNGK